MPDVVADLSYDRASDRWSCGGRDLHCGDGLPVRIGGRSRSMSGSSTTTATAGTSTRTPTGFASSRRTAWPDP